MVATAETCPRCGTARIGYFRYCLTCRLDYEATRQASAWPSAALGTPRPPSSAAPRPVESPGSNAHAASAVADPASHREPLPQSSPPVRAASADPRTLRAVAAPSTEDGASGAWRSGSWTRRRAALAVTALVLAAVALNVPLSRSDPRPAFVPPVGSISFGSSFTPATFDLSDQSRALPAGTPVALVAGLPDSMDLRGVRLVVTSAATPLLDEPVIRGVFPSPWSVVDAGERLFATTVVFPSPGTYRCALVDGRGAFLASGSFLAL